MAVSSPELVGGGGEQRIVSPSVSPINAKRHAKSRLGGSMGGAEMLGLSLVEDQRKNSAAGRGKPRCLRSSED
jgi:hypothetical protein